MTDRSSPPSDAPTEARLGAIRVEKRTPKEPVLREKLCATCGRPFQLTPEQKFYDCPDCYRKHHPIHKPRRRGGTQVLVQIQCTVCGAREYLDFTPPNPQEALCRTCFARAKRERKQVIHSNRQEG